MVCFIRMRIVVTSSSFIARWTFLLTGFANQKFTNVVQRNERTFPSKFPIVLRSTFLPEIKLRLLCRYVIKLLKKKTLE